LTRSRRRVESRVLLGTMFGKVKQPTLKEYSCPSDGLAMKFPYAPQPHTHVVHSDFKVWTVHVG
jgi:hypothetical protein